MQATFYVLGFLLLLLIMYMVYSVRRIKNMPQVPDSDKIRVLTNANFKTVTKRGITLVDFWAPWCAPCRMMAPVLNDIADSSEFPVTIGKVNVDHEQKLAGSYKVRGIPTMILFKNGREMKRYVGIKSKQWLVNEINQVVSK